MNEFEVNTDRGQGQVEAVSGADRSVLDEILREGAGRMLMTAIEAEVSDYIEAHTSEVDEAGRRRVVRNGRARQRTVVTPVGEIKVRAPRVEDRRRLRRFRQGLRRHSPGKDRQERRFDFPVLK